MKTVAVDFDRVIHDTDHPVPGRKMGPPMDGAKEAMEMLKSTGHQLIIHSCNRSEVIANWMAYWKIPYSTIWVAPGKPTADFYVDDKGIRFYNWNDTLSQIL